MNDRENSWFFGICLLVFGFGFAFGWFSHKGKVEKLPPKIPTIIEIQNLIGATPDGILGPETQDKWEKALCNQYAVEVFKEAEE